MARNLLTDEERGKRVRDSMKKNIVKRDKEKVRIYNKNYYEKITKIKRKLKREMIY